MVCLPCQSVVEAQKDGHRDIEKIMKLLFSLGKAQRNKLNNFYFVHYYIHSPKTAPDVKDSRNVH